MRSTSAILRSVLLCGCLSTLAAAQRVPGRRDGLVVTTSWLAAHLHDSDLVLLHVGDPTQYAAKHIPGARLVTLDDISVSDHAGKGLMLEMLPAEPLRAALQRLGVSDDSHVVIYHAQGRVTPATRLMFTLDYAGLGDHASLLDAGIEGWERDGHRTTAEPTAPRAGTLAPLQIKPIVVTADYVRAHLAKPGVAIVDARNTSYYDGAQIGGGPAGPHRAGHIPSAKNVPYTELTDDQSRLRSTAQLTLVFAKAGVQPGDTVVTYCHIGQQATGTLFAARMLGHPVLLYDGSFEDWSRHTDFPVELAPKKVP